MQDMRRSTGRSRLLCHCPLPCRDETRSALAALTLGLVALPSQSFAQELCDPRPEPRAEVHTAETLIFRLTQQPFVLVDGAGRVLGTHSRGDGPVKSVSEQEIIETLQNVATHEQHGAALWAFLADLDNASVVTLPIVKSLVAASATPKAREALYSELAGLARAFSRNDPSRSRERSLLLVSSSVISLL